MLFEGSSTAFDLYDGDGVYGRSSEKLEGSSRYLQTFIHNEMHVRSPRDRFPIPLESRLEPKSPVNLGSGKNCALSLLGTRDWS